MKTKSAAVIGEVIDYIQSPALITQDSIHLMLQIIVVDFCIYDLLQKNRASVRIRCRFPDVQK